MGCGKDITACMVGRKRTGWNASVTQCVLVFLGGEVLSDCTCSQVCMFLVCGYLIFSLFFLHSNDSCCLDSRNGCWFRTVSRLKPVQCSSYPSIADIGIRKMGMSVYCYALSGSALFFFNFFFKSFTQLHECGNYFLHVSLIVFCIVDMLFTPRCYCFHLGLFFSREMFE